MKQLILALPLIALSACSHLPFGKRAADMQPTDPIGQRPLTRPLDPSATRPPEGARTVQALDTTTAAEKQAALAAPTAPAAETKLGEAVVSLGLVTEPGFWLRSSLVKTAGPGRVKTAGASISVDLIPGEGAAQLSLAAFRALNLPLTGLHSVAIFAQ